MSKYDGKTVVVYEVGHYKVREFYRYACKACLNAWDAGTLLKPKDGGTPCVHGEGLWQAGVIGPRGGWYGIGPQYKTLRAAEIVCNALDRAASL